MKPFFSIIVPIYNVENYLEQCLNSILDQTCSDYEIILVDDGSCDRSGEICEQYANINKKIKVIHKKNEGLSVARNTGYSVAGGKYLIFIDSDDWWEKTDFLFKAKQALCKFDSDMLVFGNISYSESRGKTVGNRNFEENGAYLVEDIVPILVAEDRFFVSAWSRIIKKSRFVLFDNDLRTQEDMEWIFRQYQNIVTMYVLNESVYSYRRRKGSLSNSINGEKLKKRVEIFEKNIEYVEKNRWRGELQNTFFSYLSYQFILILSEVELSVEDGMINSLFEKIKKYRWLLKFAVGRKAKLSRWLIRILGLKCGGYVLAIYRRILDIYRVH